MKKLTELSRLLSVNKMISQALREYADKIHESTKLDEFQQIN